MTNSLTDMGEWGNSLTPEDLYGLLAREYEARVEIHQANTAYQVRRFSRFLPQNARVLDLGCAVGGAVRAMLDIGLVPTGIDVAPEMISYASARAPSADLVCGDFLATDFVCQFDGVYAQSVIHLFQDNELQRVFEKLRAVLATHGVLFVSTTESSHTSADWERKIDYADAPLRFRRHWTRLDFLSMLQNEGFDCSDQWNLVDPFNKSWMIFIAELRV
jgi:SAM-dependent methyltransferase